MSCSPPSNLPMLGCCGGVGCHVFVNLRYGIHDKRWDGDRYAAIVAELAALEYPPPNPLTPPGLMTGRFIQDDYRVGRTDEVAGGNSCLRSIWVSALTQSEPGNPGISQIQIVKARFCNTAAIAGALGRWCRYATWGPSENVQPNFIRCDHGAGGVEIFSESLASLDPQTYSLPTFGITGFVASTSMVFQDSPIAFERVLSCSGQAAPACCAT